MEAVLDTAFPLVYRDQVLKFLFPLFPAPTADAKSIHVYALTRILVTLNSPEMTITFLNSLVPKQKLLAYQFAFDLVEGGGQYSDGGRRGCGVGEWPRWTPSPLSTETLRLLAAIPPSIPRKPFACPSLVSVAILAQ